MPKRTRKRRGHRISHGAPRYNLMPLAAAIIFAVAVILMRTGTLEKIEPSLGSFLESSALFGHALAVSGSAQVRPEDVEINVESTDEDLRELENEPPQQILLAEGAPPETLPRAAPKEDVKSVTVSGSDGGYTGSGSVFMRNNSKFDIDLSQIMAMKNPVKLSGTGIQVLIMHTHGSEAYVRDAKNNYKMTDTDRTLDPNYNMIRVGDEIKKILTKRGIKVVHSKVLNDSPAYSGSYNRALDDITKQTKAHPSIKVVIDVHRDAMVTASGTKYKTVASIGGKNAAQLMFVTGTNGGGLKHDGWKENLSFQLRLQDRLNTKYPGIMRPINIRNERFNQHATTGSMLLEVGTSGNGLDEAIYSAQLFAGVLSDVLLGK